MAAEWHNQLEAACVQLDRAITLFLDEKDFYSAATLAGAAEDVLAGLLRDAGTEHAWQRGLARQTAGLTDAEYEAIGKEKGLSKYLLDFRNWLKHPRKDETGRTEEMYLDAEQAAVELLDRAVENRLMLSSDQSPLIKKFQEYQSSRYS